IPIHFSSFQHLSHHHFHYILYMRKSPAFAGLFDRLFYICRKCGVLLLAHFSPRISQNQAVAGSRGFGVLPKNAFGYPKAMLAKPVTGWKKTTCTADQMALSSPASLILARPSSV